MDIKKILEIEDCNSIGVLKSDQDILSNGIRTFVPKFTPVAYNYIDIDKSARRYGNNKVWAFFAGSNNISRILLEFDDIHEVYHEGKWKKIED